MSENVPSDNYEQASMINMLVAAENGETLPVIKAPAELMNVEQPEVPVSLEDLFRELVLHKGGISEECNQIDEVISMMQAKRAEIEAKYMPKIQEIEEQIKAEIVKRETPFKCAWGMATFRKGYDRTSWDSKKLSGLALLIPEVNECKTITKVEASVSLKVGYQA